MPDSSQKSNDKFTFHCYAPGDGAGGIHGWYDGLPGVVQGAIDAALEVLSNTRRSLWDERQFGSLRGVCEGLSVVRFDIGEGKAKQAWRVLAFEGPGRRRITLLYGFLEASTEDYGPACHAAKQRMRGVIGDDGRAPPCEFP